MSIARVWKDHRVLSAVIVVYILLAFLLPHSAMASVQNSLYYVVEMVMIMPVIFILTSLIEGWVPKQSIIDGFGQGAGFKGNILAFLLGSFSAGPIYAAFPVCKMLLKKGASVTNIVIVLSTWAVVKVPMLANEAKFLGPDFMLLRWVLTTVAIFLMGYVVSHQVKSSDFPADELMAPSNGLSVSTEYCIGCGLCVKLRPDLFTMVNGKAQPITTLASQRQEDLQAIAGKCPAHAIAVGLYPGEESRTS